MSAQIISTRLAAIAAPLLVWGMGIAMPANTARASDCLLAPKSPVPKGKHWYYHTDRKKRRKCWFLRKEGPPTQHTATQTTSAKAPATHASAVKKPTLAPAAAAKSTSTGANTEPLPPPKAQPASASSATAQEPVKQPVQNESMAPSTPQTSAPPASATAHAGTQMRADAPAAAAAWPDSPPVEAAKAESPDSIPAHTLAGSVPPATKTQTPDDASHDSRTIVRANASLTPGSGTSPARPLAEILLVVAFGLGMAGLLYRLVMKIADVRGRRIIIDRSAPDWPDDQHDNDWREDELREVLQRHEPVVERETFIDDSHLSLVPAAGDDGIFASRADDERQDEARGKDKASPTADGIKEREDTLAQLIRDLDQLLQSSKEA
jgi:hypothetical protein